MVADRRRISALAGRVDPAELPEAWRPAPGPDPALKLIRGAPREMSPDDANAPLNFSLYLGVTRSLSRPQVSDDNDGGGRCSEGA